jgi:histone deacetylase 11
MIPIVYHPRYNISAFGLERLHPFDGRKYRRIHDALVARGLRRPGDFVRPRPASRSDLRRVHAEEYLRSLRRPDVLARILEVPALRRLPAWAIDWRILRPMRYATGGTILTCRLALEHGVAVNLGSGFHHAASDRGGGFCVYAAVPLAVKILHDEGKIERVLVVDLDTHQGDGTAAVFRGWGWASIYDLYEQDIFPRASAYRSYLIPRTCAR